ncbi:fungal specific transcription factor domain protein [Rhizoctonia solani 123E]|uniref:Fungal specific transcription factor domain protein n=1 Tax=Rhizoctonia solani 123E TaxID=1423351 RepID=A0A074SZA9_9AGAM|nr:fungal specific transcription factor domain protein [Rhizoctonia solani 123E]
MPRAQSQSGSSAHPLPLLRRNQACHQCRRRKLKCDAQKPCSTCVRSHRFASSNNPALLHIDPDCTYDEHTVEGAPVAKPRTKYKVLEDKIGELESLLKQQLSKEQGHSPAGPPLSESTPSDAPLGTPRGNELPDLADILDPYNSLPVEEFNTMSKNQATNSPDYSGQQLTLSGWPTRLPKPDLVYHLVDVFFTCYPHAHYIIHRPSFMLSLALSPKSPKFPHVSLLHAICAYAGVFSYLIEPPPAGDLDKIYHDFIFGDRRRPDSREESFAEMHARWASETADQALTMGFNLFECTQAQVILTAFYTTQGRWVELWSSVSDALRLAVPLGLNARPGFRGDGSGRNSARLSNNPETLLPDPTNYTEREVRVNLFWVAYADERFQDAPGSWAMCLDDQDIHQFLPGDLARFEAGQDVQGTRQSLECPDVLLRHFPESTDGFSLYVKGAILVSKIKAFNLRFRYKYPNVADVHEVQEFRLLDQLITSFRNSFPQGYNHPIVQSSRGLDVHVYTAHTITHLAMILLHDKHANFYSPNCLSSSKIITAARAIIDLMYTVCSTSYDLTRLPTICINCWGRAASFLTRLYKLEISRGRQEEALTIDLEIQSVRFIFNQIGTRLPMALKYDKSLEFELQTECSQMMYSVSRQGPSSDRDEDPHDSPGASVWLGSRSSKSQDEATSPGGVGQLQSLLPDAASLPLGVNVDNPMLSFASISPSGLETLDQPFTGLF